jgi:hypothetical protein
MKRQDKKVFIVEMAKSGEAVGESPSEARIEVYFEELTDFPLEVVIAALKQARREMKWFPKIPELRDYCNDEMLVYNARHVEIHADRQLPETVTLTQEQQKQSRERVKALIREVNRTLGIQDFEQEEREKLDRIEERKEFLRQQAEELRASGEQK